MQRNQSEDIPLRQLSSFSITANHLGNGEEDSEEEKRRDRSLDQGRDVYDGLAQRRVSKILIRESFPQKTVEADQSIVIETPVLLSTQTKTVPTLLAQTIRDQIEKAIEANPHLMKWYKEKEGGEINETSKGTITLVWPDGYEAKISVLLCQAVLRTHDRVMEKLIHGVRYIPNI